MTVEQLIKNKARDTEATKFMSQNPAETFHKVGDKFGFSHTHASRLWEKTGFPSRRPGRKTKKEKPTT